MALGVEKSIRAVGARRPSCVGRRLKAARSVSKLSAGLIHFYSYLSLFLVCLFCLFIIIFHHHLIFLLLYFYYNNNIVKKLYYIIIYYYLYDDSIFIVVERSSY